MNEVLIWEFDPFRPDERVPVTARIAGHTVSRVLLRLLLTRLHDVRALTFNYPRGLSLASHSVLPGRELPQARTIGLSE